MLFRWKQELTVTAPAFVSVEIGVIEITSSTLLGKTCGRPPVTIAVQSAIRLARLTFRKTQTTNNNSALNDDCTQNADDLQ